MLRIHFTQQRFGLSNLAMEEDLLDTSILREFASLYSMERIPDWGSVLQFRHLLEANELSAQIMASNNATLTTKGLLGAASNYSGFAGMSTSNSEHQTTSSYRRGHGRRRARAAPP